MNLNKLLKKAISLKNNPDGKYQHFTFIIRKNKILSIGWNITWKTHPLGYRFGTRFSSIHSEMAAIIKFPFPPGDLASCTLLNVRLGKHQEPHMSKPCLSCQKLLIAFGIKNILFTNTKGDLERL